MVDPDRSSARWADVRGVFEEALDVAEAERGAWLVRRCAGDDALLAEVRRLLALRADDERDPSGGAGQPPASAALLAALAEGARGASPAAGERLGTWTLLRPLGAGGMGEVWEAEQEHPRRRAALKLLRPGLAGARARRRFHDEVDALARLEHPAIARILEAGEHAAGGGDPRPWYAMELVPGARPITELARAGGPGWRERVELFRTVCAAVDHGHRNGVIHRDLKPGNILVGEDGRPRVIDFGVARMSVSATDAAEIARRTQAGEIVGTLAAMAPEQLDGRADVRTDVHALGLVLHELLAGAPPFDTTGLALGEIARRVRERVPAPPSAHAPGLPRELDWITARALEKDPERRYASAAVLGEELGRVLRGEPVLAGPPTALYRARSFVRRHRVGVGVAALVFVLLAGGIAGTTSGWRTALAAQATAEEHAAEARAVTAFLVDVFGTPDPELAGVEARVVDALGLAEERLSAFVAGHPRAEVALRTALGGLRAGLGQSAEAVVQYERALALAEEARVAGAPSIADEGALRGRLAGALVDGGQLDRAEALLTGLDAGAADDRLRVELRRVLARLRHRQGRLEEAEACYREALQAARRLSGERGPDAARVAGDLGSVLIDLDRLDEAEALLGAALADLRAALGPAHPRALAAVNNLSAVLASRQRWDEAAALLQEAVDARLARLPPAHPAVLATRANLASQRLMQGDADEAASILQDLLGQMLATTPAHDRQVLTLLCNLASTVHARGDGAPAVRAAVERVLDARAGEAASEVLAAEPLDDLARNLEAWQMPAEALAVCEQAVMLRARLRPEGEPAALSLRALRARLWVAAGRVEDVPAELEAIAAAARSRPDEDPVRRAALNFDLARAWIVSGRPEPAEPLLREAVELLEPGGHLRELYGTITVLAMLCERSGRAEDAAAWRARFAARAAAPPATPAP